MSPDKIEWDLDMIDLDYNNQTMTVLKKEHYGIEKISEMLLHMRDANLGTL